MTKLIISEKSIKYVENEMYSDPEISFESRGLITTLIKISENNELDLSNLSTACGIEEWTVRKELLHLELAGLLLRQREQIQGRFVWKFYLFACPEERLINDK